MKHPIHFLITLLLLALLAACVSTETNPAPEADASSALAEVASKENSEDAAYPRTITDFEGREVTIDAPPQSIVIDNRSYVLGSMLALGIAPTQMHVYPYPFSDEPTDAMPWEEEVLQQLGIDPERIESPDGQYSLEVLARVQPDLIIANPLSYGDGLTNLDQLEALAPTVLIAGARDWRANIQIITDALGKPDLGEQFVAEIEAKIDDVVSYAKELGATSKTFAIVSFATDGQVYVCTDKQYGPTNLMLSLGLEMTPDVEALDLGVCTPLSLESLNLLDSTDYLLIFEFGGFTVEEAQTEPVINAMPALQAGRYDFIPDSALGIAFDDLNPLSIDILLPTLRSAVEKAAQVE